MAKNEKTRNIRVGESLAAKAEANAKKLHWSFNQFGQEAIRVICEMVDDPKARVVPEVVLMIDNAELIRSVQQAPLPTSIKSRISAILEAAAESAEKITASHVQPVKKYLLAFLAILLIPTALAEPAEKFFRMNCTADDGLLVNETIKMAAGLSEAKRNAGLKPSTYWMDLEPPCLLIGYSKLPVTSEIFSCKVIEAGTRSLGPKFGNKVAQVYQVTP